MEEVLIKTFRYVFACPEKTHFSTQTLRLRNFQSWQVQIQRYRALGEATLFRKYYERGDLPVAVNFQGALRKVKCSWLSSHGRWNLSILITISTYPFSFKGLDRLKIPTNFWQAKAQISSSKKAQTNYYLSYLNSSFQSKVDIPSFRSPLFKRPWYYVRDFEENPKTSFGRLNDRRSLSPLLQTNSACLQHVQEQKT